MYKHIPNFSVNSGRRRTVLCDVDVSELHIVLLARLFFTVVTFGLVNEKVEKVRERKKE